MAQTLMRATRLAQVISVLGNEKDLETTVERAAIEVGRALLRRHGAADPRLGRGTEHRRSLGRRRLRPAAGGRSRCPPSRRSRASDPCASDPSPSVPVPDWLESLLAAPRCVGAPARRRQVARPDAARAPRRRAVRGVRGDRAARRRLPHRARDRERPAPQGHDRSARAAPPPPAADRGARRHARARRRRPARRRDARLRGGRLLERRADRPQRRARRAVERRRARRARASRPTARHRARSTTAGRASRSRSPTRRSASSPSPAPPRSGPRSTSCCCTS